MFASVCLNSFSQICFWHYLNLLQFRHSKPSMDLPLSFSFQYTTWRISHGQLAQGTNRTVHMVRSRYNTFHTRQTNVRLWRWYRWLRARLQWLQWVSNGDTTAPTKLSICAFLLWITNLSVDFMSGKFLAYFFSVSHNGLILNRSLWMFY